MVMSRDEFVSLLTPAQLRFFSSAIAGGLALYADPSNYSPKALRDHNPAIRAQIRQGHIISEARRLIGTDPAIGIAERHIRHRLLFLVSSRAYVSFKRLDNALRGHNYPTTQARMFNSQRWPRGKESAFGDEIGVAGDTILRPSLWLPSVLPDMINVWAGYSPDKTETQFGFYIVCPDGELNAWEWPLTGTDIDELTRTSRPSETAAATKARRRANPRPGAAKKKQASDGSMG